MRIKFLFYILPLSLLLLVCPFGASTQGAEKYVPPSLFGVQKLPPPLPPHPRNNLKLPPISKPVELSVPPSKPAPVSTKPVLQKVKEVKVEEVVLEEPKEAPLPEHKPQYKPKYTSVPKSVGVVKGPKAMPANKKQAVEVEETYKAVDLKPVTPLKPIVIEGVPAVKVVEAQLPEVEIVGNVKLPPLVKQADGSRKLVLGYAGHQADMQPDHRVILDKVIVPELAVNKGFRVIIQAYASSDAAILSSDRRIALSRALAIREYLLKKDIKPNRIDVRALGAKTDIHPIDRVEFYLVP